MQAVKETAANIAASALSGMEKTRAVIDEKVEKISTSDPVEKDMATLRKEDRIRLAELRKQEAYNQNAAAAAAGGGPGSPTFTAAGGGPGSPTFTAAGHVEKNPFHKGTTEVKDVHKPVAGQHGHDVTVQPATSAVQPARAVST